MARSPAADLSVSPSPITHLHNHLGCTRTTDKSSGTMSTHPIKSSLCSTTTAWRCFSHKIATYCVGWCIIARPAAQAVKEAFELSILFSMILSRSCPAERAKTSTCSTMSRLENCRYNIRSICEASRVAASLYVFHTPPRNNIRLTTNGCTQYPLLVMPVA